MHRKPIGFEQFDYRITRPGHPSEITTLIAVRKAIRRNQANKKHYVLLTYALTVSKSGTGSGTVTSSPSGINCGATCSASFNYNTARHPDRRRLHRLDLRRLERAGCSGTGTCTVPMTAAQSVTATFTLNTYALTVTKAGAGSGTVTSAPTGITCGATCSASFNYNTNVVLTAAASTGSTFNGWSGNAAVQLRHRHLHRFR